MKMGSLWYVIALAVAAAPVTRLTAQVQTNVPEAVSGAKAVTVERIKVHGDSLEGNLEGDAVDRDVIVFLPPGYAKNKNSDGTVAILRKAGINVGQHQSGGFHAWNNWRDYLNQFAPLLFEIRSAK